MVILTNVFYRLFGNSLLLCLYALSLVRLEISWQPFRFKAHSHGRLSVLLLVLILGLPLVEVAVRLAVVPLAEDTAGGEGEEEEGGEVSGGTAGAAPTSSPAEPATKKKN